MDAPALSFQPSLWSADPTERDASFARAERIELGQGAWIDHAPDFLAGADTLFESVLSSVSWRQREVPMYGRLVTEPRLTAWWDDADATGDEEMRRAPEQLRRLLPLLDLRYDHGFDCIGLALYRDGRDSVAWHGDRTERDRPVTTVAVLSLGSPRRFLLRPSGGGHSRAIEMFSGDLLVMGGTCQHTFEHCIPKVSRAGPRMSATFRRRVHAS